MAGLFRAEGLADTGLHLTPDGSKAVIGRAHAPHGAPTVLLYSHYDVQPAPDTSERETSPFQLTQSGGHWHGRGAADCKGNIVWRATVAPLLPDVPRSGLSMTNSSPACVSMTSPFGRRAFG